MRTRVSVLLTAMLTAAAAVFAISPAAPASAQLVTEQPFAAYGTGTALSVNALTLGATTTGGVHAAFSGATVNSTGATGTINDEFGQAVQPPLSGKYSYGRGTGLEVGLLVPAAQQTDVNQLLLSGLAQAAAPPPTPLITKDIALDLQPVAFASLLRGQAQAVFDKNTCAIGQPLSFGRGFASNLQLVGPVGSAAAATNVSGNNASESRTFTYLTPNGDGTFGLVSETHQHVAPISILGGAITIEVLGELGMRVTATGKPGGSSVQFLGNPVLTVKIAGVPVPGLGSLSLSSLFGGRGLTLPIGGLAQISLGAPPRALGGPVGSVPSLAANGTSASAGYDAIGRVSLLALPGLTALDLGIGHMEAAVTVPAGGIHCNIPVAKSATPNPAQAGDDVTWTISIPDDAASFAKLFACDLLNISATDTHSVLSGNPRFQLTSASNGGVINGNTVTWANLGNYRRGDPPIKLTITGHIIGGTGVLQDIANVTATLANCTGGAAGQDIAGQASFQNNGLTGGVRLVGPEVNAGNLASTGGDSRYLLFGGFLLLGALEMRRRLRGRAPATTRS
ncbi:MAG: hypothetical protein ABR511_02610 [Acidimicrobiales bacterium]